MKAAERARRTAALDELLERIRNPDPATRAALAQSRALMDAARRQGTIIEFLRAHLERDRTRIPRKSPLFWIGFWSGYAMGLCDVTREELLEAIEGPGPKN